MKSKPRFLIVNADDFNLDATSSRAIRGAHGGILTATSVIVTLPVAPRDVAWLKSAEGLSVGLHFSLEHGTPLSASARRTAIQPAARRRDGRTGIDDPDALQAELEAQYEAFVALLGVAPTHLHTHHDPVRLATVTDVLLELALSFRLPVRAADGTTRSRVRSSGLPTPDVWLPLEGAERWTRALLEKTLTSLGPGVTEVDGCRPRPSGAGCDVGREEWIRLLADGDLRDVAAKAGVRLTGYRDLANLTRARRP